jgi:ribosomal protein S18 acetylase RimI-like enzyme
MDGYLESNFTTEVILRELNDANVRFLVACLGEDIVAFSTLRLGTSEPCIESYPKCIELQRIYVDSTLHGTGTARTLMGVTLDLAKTEGYKTVWLGVWEHNVRAFRFYQKYGFEKVGGHVFMLGNERQTDWIVVKAL